MIESIKTFGVGVMGVVAPASGFTISLLPQIESWLRIVSLLIGCAVGIASLVVILRGKKKD